MSMKKICCLFMTAIIVLSILAIPVFATEEEKENPEETTTVATSNTTAEDSKEPVVSDEPENTSSSETEEKESPEQTEESETTTASPEPVDIVIYPNENGMFATLTLVKKDGNWQVVEEEYYEKEKDIPKTVVISPESGDKHANIILEKVELEDESGSEWQITEEHYYASKLLVLPIIIVVFFIVLALMIMINLVLIKLHKR